MQGFIDSYDILFVLIIYLCYKMTENEIVVTLEGTSKCLVIPWQGLSSIWLHVGVNVH